MAVQAPALTVVDAAWPARRGLAMDVFLVVAAGSVMALFARAAIYLPFTDVPIGLGTLWVLLTGAALGSRRGALAMVAYLGEGLAGLPVFAAGNNAWSPSTLGGPYILGATAGYLFSYPIAAFVVGFLAERGWDRGFGRCVAAMLCGEAVILALGVSWLSVYRGFAVAVVQGMLPFLPGDLLKVAVAAGVLPSAWRLLPRQR